MKVQTKIIWLIVIISVMTLITIFGFRVIELQLRDLHFQSLIETQEMIIDNSLKSRYDELSKPLFDYTGWDDMVEKTQNPDQEWGIGNIKTIIPTFGVQFVWVYDDKGTLIYFYSDSLAEPISLFTEGITKINDLFLESHVIEYYMTHGKSVIEILGTGIVPTSDYLTRKSIPTGYMVFGKIWDQDFLESLSVSTGTQVRFLKQDNPPLILNRSANFNISKPLKGPDNKILGYIEFARLSPYLAKENQVVVKSFIFSIVFILLSLLVYIYFSKRWLSKPLTLLNQSLNKNDVTIISPLIGKNDEFGTIGRLIGKYFEINQKLKDEIESRILFENSLQQSEEKVRAILNATTASVFMLDNEGIIIEANAIFCSTLNLERSKIIGKRIWDISDFNSFENWKQIIQNVFFTREPLRLEDERNGQWFDFVVFPVINKEIVVSVAVFANNITEKKNAENERIKLTEKYKEAKEKAEESDKLKSILLANMSHEFRTPMNGILGFAQILEMETDTPELQICAKNISESAERLMKTLNSIMLLGQIESGLKPTLELCGLNDIFSQIEFFYSQKAFKKNIKLNFENAGNLKIPCDSYLLYEVLSHLVDNAIKFTKEGSVSVKVESLTDEKLIKICVTDTGIGIPKHQFSKIFADFRQGDEGHMRTFEGSGIGLSIAKKAVTLMNGKLELDSSLGKGSCFSITFNLGSYSNDRL